HRLKQAERRRPKALQEARDTDRRIKGQYNLLKELEDTVKSGDRSAMGVWMEAAKDFTDEFLRFKPFFYDRARGFTGYFRRKGDWFIDAAIIELASFANRMEEGSTFVSSFQRS